MNAARRNRRRLIQDSAGGRLFSSRGAPGAQRFEIFRKREGQARAFFHVALHRFLIAAQDLALIAVLELAALDIEEEVDLPRTKRVPVQASTEEFLDEPVELSQNRFTIGERIDRHAFYIGRDRPLLQ